MSGVGTDAKKTIAKAEAVAEELSRQIEVMSFTPSGSDIKEEVLRRTSEFLDNLEDKEKRLAFNNWANTLGLEIEITHSTGQMRLKKNDGGFVLQLDVHREGETIVLDQTRQDAALCGLKL